MRLPRPPPPAVALRMIAPSGRATARNAVGLVDGDAARRAAQHRHAEPRRPAPAPPPCRRTAPSTSGDGPTNVMPASAQRRGERGVLGEEPVAGMDRVGAGLGGELRGPGRCRGRRRRRRRRASGTRRPCACATTRRRRRSARRRSAGPARTPPAGCGWRSRPGWRPTTSSARSDVRREEVRGVEAGHPGPRRQRRRDRPAGRSLSGPSVATTRSASRRVSRWSPSMRAR